MTTNESLRLHGFWTHKRTKECIAVKRITMFGEAHARKVDSNRNEVGPKEIMLLRDLKKEYVKGAP